MTAGTVFRAASIGAATLACALASAAFAAETAPRDCFNGGEVSELTAVTDQAVFLQLRTGDYYRIDLAKPVKQMRSPTAQLSLTSYGRKVCNANDLSVYVHFSGDMGLNLGVAKLTKLSAEEVATAGPENLPGRRYRGGR
jgi:hypothetical protein